MKLPQIDLSSLPDLDTLTGMFGSLVNPARAMPASDDTIVVLMTWVYDTLGPEGLF